MHISFSWLKTRRKNLGSLSADLILSICIFQFLKAPASELRSPLLFALISTIWVLSSYVGGRYYDYENPNNFYSKQLVGTFVTVAITYVMALVIAVCFDFLSYAYIKEVYYYVVTLCVFSAPLMLVVNLIYSDDFRKKKSLYLGTKRNFDELSVYKNSPRAIHHTEYLGHFDLSGIDFRQYKEIIVDDSNSLSDELENEIINIKLQGHKFVTPLQWCDSYLDYSPLHLISANSIIYGNFNISRTNYQLRIKYVLEAIIAFIIIVISLPLTLIISALIYIEDRGPIFYKQIRNGQYMQKITIYKFRSMKIDAEKSGPQWASSNDRRITSIGKFIRKSRIDEIPQLISVIKGEMSLIGPRPERPFFDDQFLLEIPHYSLKFAMKPGLSGWAQVNCNYGASIEDTKLRLAHDIYYLRNFSVFLDFLILVKTIKLVLNMDKSEPN